MLIYTAVSLISTWVAKQSPWNPMLTANTGFWILAILVLPPDPRFYFGPILLTLYGSTCWIELKRESSISPCNNQSWKIFVASALSILIFTSQWRASEVARNDFPRSTLSSQATSRGLYYPRMKRQVNTGKNEKCWMLTPPCSPE